MDLVLTPLVVAGIGSLAGKLADPASNIAVNVVSSQIFDPLCRSLRGAAARRIREMDGSLPHNHDVERAVRTAQLDASRVLAAAFARRAKRLNRPSDERFARNALAWIEQEAKAVSRLEVDRALLDQLVAALDAPLAADADLAAEAARATYVAFGELAAGAGDDAPDGFWDLWASGDDTSSSWFAAFGDFLAEQTKTDDRFYRMVTAAGLAETGAGVRRIEDMLAEREPVWTGLRETADQVILGLDRIETKIDDMRDDTAEILRMLGQMSAGNDDKAALLAEIEALRANNSLTTRAIETFLRDVGETALTPDQWPNQLALFAERYRQLLAELARRTNLRADLEAERARAAKAAETGDLDAAEKILAALTERLSARRHAQQEMLDQDARDAATLLSERAAFAKARLRYQEAANLYSQAASTTPIQDTQDRWYWTMEQASVLCNLGCEFGDNDALKNAIELLRNQALPLAPRDHHPFNWARTQNNLGTVFGTLGERESGTIHLEEATIAFQAALEELTRERLPLEWAKTQHNLGNILLTIGTREGSSGRIETAILAYRAALEERTRERDPLAWAMTQNNLGVALSTLASHKNNADCLEEAVAAYRASLEERTRQRVPLDWAATQNNLGTALRAVGMFERKIDRLEEAVIAYRAALEEQPRHRVPLDWALTQHNLGNLLTSLGVIEGRVDRLEEAIVAYRAAIEERTRQRVPLEWAKTQNSLGKALWFLSKRDNGIEILQLSIAAYRASLDESPRQRVPTIWAMTTNNLAEALGSLSEKSSDLTILDQAITMARSALEVYKATNLEHDIKTCTNLIAHLEAKRGP